MWKARLSELEFDEQELAAVLDVIDSEWITAGPRTQAFEKAFAGMTGTTDAVAVSNGTAALFLAMKALGIGPGDEVLCPSLTFVATAAAVMNCGAVPVLVDICSLQNPTMDPADARRKITVRTKALLPVHFAGIPANMEEFRRLAEAHGLLIIEDAAHAPGGRYGDRACGDLGNAGCFSLFGNKNITTAEGGMITTNDTELARKMRLLRSHGMSVTSWDRDKGRPGHYDVEEFGFNFRLDDIRAALGLVQLKKLAGLNERRRILVDRYNQRMSESNPDLILPFGTVDPIKQPSYHIYPVIFPDRDERDSMEAILRAEGIQTSIHYRPIHHFTAYQKVDPTLSLRITEDFSSRELTFPLYPSLREDQVDMIVSTLTQCRQQTSVHRVH